MVCDTYGDTVDNIVRVVYGSSVSGPLEEDEDWNLGYISLSKNADVRASLPVDFTAIKTLCSDFTLAVPEKACNVLGLALRGLDALQETEEATKRVAALGASRTDQLAKTDALRNHQREPLDEIRSLEHQLFLKRVETKLHEA